MTAPIFVEGERIVHRAYRRHERREQRIETALCAVIVLGALLSVCLFLAATAGVAWLIAGAVR